MKSAILKTTILAALTLSVLPTDGQARGQMTIDQAIEKCTVRAVQFGRQPYGRFGEEPPEYRVQTEYRACVYANSGQYPSARVEYRDSVLTLLKDVFK